EGFLQPQRGAHSRVPPPERQDAGRGVGVHRGGGGAEHSRDLRRHCRPGVCSGDAAQGTGAAARSGPGRGGASMILATVLAAIAFYWHLPILIAVVSVVYSATRFDDWNAILREAFRWGLRMGAFLVGIGVVLYLVSRYV